MKPELIGKLIDGGAVPNAGTLLLSLISVIMALYSGYISNYIEDIWREELLPGFQEVILNGSDLPEDGRIYVMYHGTTYSAAKDIILGGFEQSEDGMLGPGVYVSRDINKALRYPLYDKSNQVVLKLRVSVGKVKKINYQDHPLQVTWHEHGYDTAWVPPYCGMVPSGLEEDCVWDPRRIKLVGIAKAPPQHLEELNCLLGIYQRLFGDESYESQQNDELYQSDKSDEIDIRDPCISSQQKKIEKLIQTLKLSFNIEASENMAREIDEKLWQEETLPYFRKILLCSGDKPNDGTIYEMYHGTNLESAILIIQNGFKRSNDDNMLGSGVYVSRDREKAARYPLVGKRYQVILKLRVNVGKVKKIDRQGHPLPKTWHEEGYDTAWVPEDMVESGLEEDCTVYGTQKGSKL
ncbi:uncharacterized protein [Phyllobates terribilis]|uniref:uncharacterized protein isoform X1 n=1 Tax=Phyllobates terribilis TaxID=111132 RepID=UPI003CCA7F7A